MMYIILYIDNSPQWGFSVTIYNSTGNQIDIAQIAIYNYFLQIKSNVGFWFFWFNLTSLPGSLFFYHRERDPKIRRVKESANQICQRQQNLQAKRSACKQDLIRINFMKGDVKLSFLRFWRQSKPAAVNLSFFAFARKPFLLSKRKCTSPIFFNVTNLE